MSNTAEQEPVFLPPVTCFDVMVQQSIGTVEISEYGNKSPYSAAMALIAENDAPGIYTFPFPTGGNVTVTVEYPDGNLHSRGVDSGR